MVEGEPGGHRERRRGSARSRFRDEGRRDESIATDDVERPVTRSLVEASTKRLPVRHRRTAGLNIEVGVPQAVITTLEGAYVEVQVARALHLACS